jgi:hypothetical protein
MIVLAGTVLFGSAGQAINSTGAFEMDGNAVTTASDDWDEVCHQVLGGDCSTTNDTSGATAVSWTSDNLLDGTPSLNASIFTGGGSKDPNDVNQWAWKDGAGGLPDKANLLHSFAARYSLTPSATCPVGTGTPTPTTCDVLFFGNDRYDNSGDAVQAFWFFQDEITLGDPATQPLGGGTAFNGVHMDGDLLIISEFSNGGTVSTINIYEWDSSVSGNLSLLASSTAARCDVVPANSAFCGIVNPTDGTVAPWPFLDKSGNVTYLQGEFFEGGVNLTLLGLADRCFASVMSETRTSTSTTSVLKDFVLGTFGNCDTTLTTTPLPDTSMSIGADASVAVQDSAALTVNGIPSWTGTLSFHLCGPIAAPALCTAGGTAVSSGTVTQATPQPIVSGTATVTSVGRYCWRAVFDSGTEGVPDATDATAGECFTVDPVTPTLTTNATPTVEIGNPISDTATLSGTANQPGSPVINPTTAGGPAGGTITFNAYGPDDATCSGTPAFTSAAIAVSGDGTNYNSGDFTPTSAGTYRWTATYSGDSPNTNGASSACNAANETTVVSPKTPTIITFAVAGPVPLGGAISDTATIGNTAPKPDGTPAGGTVTFMAYGPDDATCAGPAAFTSAAIPVSGDGNYGSGDFTPTLAGTYRWIATYTGDAPNTSGPVSTSCNDPNESSLVVQLQPAITTAQTFTVKDSATITVGAGAGDLAGSVRFRLYDNATCTEDVDDFLLYDSGAIAVSGASPQVVESGTTTITTSEPTLSWLVEYTSTNAGHTDVTSTCNTENASLLIDNG